MFAVAASQTSAGSLKGFWTRWRAVLCTAAAIVSLAPLASCAVGRPESPQTPSLRIGFAGVVDFGDLASELASDELRTQGFRVETVSFATAEIAADALARGEVDVAIGSTRAFWAAAAKDAPIRTVLEHSVNVHRLVGAGRELCAAVDGRRLALQSEGAAGTALARALLAERCPSARPDVIMVPGSTNRLTALLSGSIDATVLQMSDVSRLMTQAPGRFAVLADFHQQWPALQVTGVHVNTRFATDHPAWVEAYVRARLQADARATHDVDIVTQYAERLLGPDPRWPQQAREYADLPVWPRRGGLTRDGAAETLAFLQTRSGLAAHLSVDRVIDLSFLERALSAGSANPVADSSR